MAKKSKPEEIITEENNSISTDKIGEMKLNEVSEIPVELPPPTIGDKIPIIPDLPEINIPENKSESNIDISKFRVDANGNIECHPDGRPKSKRGRKKGGQNNSANDENENESENESENVSVNLEQQSKGFVFAVLNTLGTINPELSPEKEEIEIATKLLSEVAEKNKIKSIPPELGLLFFSAGYIASRSQKPITKSWLSKAKNWISVKIFGNKNVLKPSANNNTTSAN